MGQLESGEGSRPGLSRLPALYGFARSLAIYYGLPHRAWQLRRFYGQFIGSGDMCFDVGTHVGNRLRALSRLGAFVIGVEPHPLFAKFLRKAYGDWPGVVIVEQAVGASSGRAELRASRRTPTVSTTSSEWAAAVGSNQAFERVNWDYSYPVTVTTLDQLIAEFGPPRFCKLDVEGSELSVLQGLSMPLPHLSFEYIPAVVPAALDCLERLGELGDYEFNWTVGESYRLRSREWLTKSLMAQRLQSMPSDHRSGDIYARLSHPIS